MKLAITAITIQGMRRRPTGHAMGSASVRLLGSPDDGVVEQTERDIDGTTCDRGMVQFDGLLQSAEYNPLAGCSPLVAGPLLPTDSHTRKWG